MITKYIDTDNRFYELFDRDTGLYIRSGIMENGKDTGVEPFMRSFPGLIDVGVMGQCAHGISGYCQKSGTQCYQNGASIVRENMTLDNFCMIVDQCRGKVFQLALGGRGDVDQHENCEEILAYSRENDIVPNFTTSGFGLTRRIVEMLSEYVGAVAVSWYRAKYTHNAIEMLVGAGIKTNIHYILGKNTIDEAIERLDNDSFPKGINAVIFLLHKPKGQGTAENILISSNAHIRRFFELVDKKRYPFKVGFDSCSCAGILNHTECISFDSIDYCEGARFSCYIDAQMKMMPCSFAADVDEWQVCLNHISIEEAWNSNAFAVFRSHLAGSCSACNLRQYCGGGCPLFPEITLCAKAERTSTAQLLEQPVYR